MCKVCRDRPLYDEQGNLVPCPRCGPQFSCGDEWHVGGEDYEWKLFVEETDG